MATVTTHVTLSCRKREMPSFDGGAGASSSKKRKLTEPSPPAEKKLNDSQSPAKIGPWSDLPKQATCLILFFFVVARMSTTMRTPTSPSTSPHSQQASITKAQKRPQLGYVDTTKALSKLDILNSTVRELLTGIDGLLETAAEVDWILNRGKPELANSVTRTKDDCQKLIDSIQDRLAFLDQ